MRFASLRPFILLACLAAGAEAQTTCPSIAYAVRTWVDPVNGSDVTGTINSQAFPFRTLNLAVSQTSGAVGFGNGLVTALPGIYSTASNGEVLPIVMHDNVHVQGIGAKECVLRGGGSWLPKLPADTSFLPTVPVGGGTPGSNSPFEIGFDFSFTSVLGDLESSLENFTIQGCTVQVYSYTQGDGSWRVSNCLFDMRNQGLDGIAGPDFGVLMVNAAVASQTGEPVYHHVTPKVFNNTFVQATILGDGWIEVALPENVAICDTNDPAPGPIIDPTPYLFGISDPSIQSNLIRDLPGLKRTAMLGIDRTDTTIVTGTVTGRTNAFDPLEALSIDLTGTYHSRILGQKPQAKVDTSIFDPAFVGELLGVWNSSQSLPFLRIRDFRLVPDSKLRDMGSAPSYASDPCNGTFTAQNGTSYVDHPPTAWDHGAFDYDGEGHGNFRGVSSFISGARPDIGFDEADNLIVAGCYGNESRSHNLPWDPTINPGDSYRAYIAPVASGSPPVFMSLMATSAAYPAALAYSFYPRLAPLGASYIPAPGMAPSWFWLATPITLMGTFPMNPISVADVLNPVVMHTFLLFQPSVSETGPPTFFNEQAFYVDSSGNPILVFPLDRLSNAQSEHF
jgi:hypothetical protein